jgi:NitT/TauT family transport system permease protein
MISAIVIALLALAALVLAPRLPFRLERIAVPGATCIIGLASWHLACVISSSGVFPTPWSAARGMASLLRDGTIFRYAIASLFRVGCGFTIAATLGIPIGLWAGWSTRAFEAINPLIQALRPISPIAWLPVSILWFGVGDQAAIFIIFLSTFFPIVMGTVAAVRGIPLIYVRSAQNFGIEGVELFRRVVFPAALPQIITSIRVAMGIAWLVVVAAEMLAVNSGLGYLINDARNMGMRYDLVVGAMICVGLIGVGIDGALRRLERCEQVRWGFPKL